MAEEPAPVLVSFIWIHKKGDLCKEEENREEHENDTGKLSFLRGIQFARDEDEDTDRCNEQDQ